MVERTENGRAGGDTHVPTVRAAGNRPRTARRSVREHERATDLEHDDNHHDPALARRYAPFAAVFAVIFVGLMHAAARRGTKEPHAVELEEAVLATFFITRLVAREKIGSVVREPFVKPAPGTDPADAHGEAKEPAGTGVRYAIGELLTCTRCLGPWAAALITSGQVIAPRQARVATRVLALAGANNLLHALFAWITARANASK
ncbi:MAG: hypothetical protein JWO69_1668 [Thermoleophilia bacterium]|nr:hypothetical protein [Thermoleophilia bacterium]